MDRRNDDLDKIKDELDNVSKIKLDFLSHMYHELRTPLTSIKAYCDILLMLEDEEKETREEFLQYIIEECNRLVRMINNILDASKMESGKMEWYFHPVNLTEVVPDSVNIMRNIAQNKGLSLEMNISEKLPSVRGDRDKLVQVITNLLDNAIKFTKEGEIVVGAELLDNEVKLYVSDTGIGIAAENQEIIFGKFNQVGDILTSKPPGSGLGLSICREIVNYHGGRIWVESDVGVGSTFYFTLPITKETGQ